MDIMMRRILFLAQWVGNLHKKKKKRLSKGGQLGLLLKFENPKP
jgi:hypothetical protein